jgi:hypothetical protein
MEAPRQSQPVPRPYMRLVVGKHSPRPGAAAAAPAPSDQPKKRKSAQKKAPKPDAKASEPSHAQESQAYVIDPLTVFNVRRG